MSSTSKTNHPTAVLNMYGQKVRFMVDSCADVNTLDLEGYTKIGKPPMLPTNKRIKAYATKTPLQIVGKLRTMISVDNSAVETSLYVINDENTGCLLSKTTSKNLGLITFSPLVQCNVISSMAPIGKLKNKQIKLHIDPTVPSVAQHHRRIPYHLRPAVEAQLKRLEEMDVIEKVEQT